MAMPLGFATRVSLYSMRKRVIRTVLSLLPCVLLIAIMFVGSTIPNGLVNEIDEKVLNVAENRQEYLLLDSFMFSEPDFSSTSGGPGGPSLNFNQEKFKLATESPYVDDVYPQRGTIGATIGEIGTVLNASVQFGGTSEEFAKLYSPEPFVYADNEPIPMLISPSSISGTTYNWNGATTLEIDYGNPSDAVAKQSFTTLKNPEKLVGTTVTVNFGNFPNLPEAFEETSFGGFGPPKAKLMKLTDQDRDILNRRIGQLYSPYWDVKKLSVPITRQFKIIGIVNGQQGSTGAYIPNEAVTALWNSVYQRQIGARTTKAIDKETLANEPQKVEVVDGFVQEGFSFGAGMTTWQKDPSVSAWQVDLSNVGIPGLLVEARKNARGQNEYRTYEVPALTQDNFRVSGAIVKLKSADDRDEYVKFLNDNGLYYFDNSPVALIKGIRKGSNIFVTWLTIILGTIVAFILLITMSRFVADSRREIGVWRAIGATRLDIVKMVLVRMSLLLLIGIGFGILLGYGGSILLGQAIVNGVNESAGGINPYGVGGGNFIGQLVLSFLGGQVPQFELAKLIAPNWQLLGSRLGLLALITLLVGLIPALRASRISPVTAIRDSE